MANHRLIHQLSDVILHVCNYHLIEDFHSSNEASLAVGMIGPVIVIKKRCHTNTADLSPIYIVTQISDKTLELCDVFTSN